MKEINLVEILKDAPKGIDLWCSICGTVVLNIVCEDNASHVINVLQKGGTDNYWLTKEGKMFSDGDCILFPSKDIRSWENFKLPEALPKTWEEFCKSYPIKESEYYITSCSFFCTNPGNRREEEHKNMLPNKELAEAMLALCQLIQLRDCYNAGWKPNWKDCSYKYVIYNQEDKITIGTSIGAANVLTFKDTHTLDEFYINFGSLLETAKQLL